MLKSRCGPEKFCFDAPSERVKISRNVHDRSDTTSPARAKVAPHHSRDHFFDIIIKILENTSEEVSLFEAENRKQINHENIRGKEAFQSFK